VATVRTEQRRRLDRRERTDLLEERIGLSGELGEQGASLRDAGRAVAVGEEAVMANLDEAGRQDVETEAAQELLQREEHRADLAAVGVVFVPEGDRMVGEIQGFQAAVGNGHPVRVAAQVGQDDLGARKGAFGVDDPLATADATEPPSELCGLRELRLRTGEVELAVLKELL